MPTETTPQVRSKIGCGHEDIEEALSNETSLRYTVKSYKHSFFVTKTISKIKKINRLHANNGTSLSTFELRKTSTCPN